MFICASPVAAFCPNNNCLLVLEPGAANGVRLAEGGGGALGVALDEKGDEEDDGDEEAKDDGKEGTERHIQADGAAIDGNYAGERRGQLLHGGHLHGHLGRRKLRDGQLAGAAQRRPGRREGLSSSHEACERGDDASSLNVNSGQRTVMVLRDERGIKASCGAIAWHADGNTIMCGGADGSLQLWEMRAGDYKPVVLKKDATPRVEAISDKVKASNVVRGAHEAGADISSVRWHRDGNRLASRSTDGTLKLWDLRRFDTPLAAWGALPNIYGMAGCDFSPDGELLIAGTSVKKGDGAAQIVVVSTSTLQRVSEIDVDGASVVALSWHPRLNQILVGSADGGVYVMYDPEVSQKGAMLCANKAPPKRATHVYTGGAMQIMTPHALPMFKDEQLDHRKRRREDRRDPLRSQKPELVKTGPGTGGRLSVGYQQALLASLPGGVSGLAGTKDKIEAFKVEDAREEILKYAKLAEEDPHFVTPAYAVNQPATLSGAHLAKTVDSEDDEEDQGQ